jgi:hypothetical protein
MPERCCANANCRRPITGCFGYTLGRDFLELLEGRLRRVRELCGRCVEAASLLPQHLKERFLDDLPQPSE